MKKLFVLLCMLSATVGAFATSNGFRVSADSTWNKITIASYIVSSDLPSPSDWRIIANKVGDTVIIQGDTIPYPTLGLKENTVSGLSPSTLYQIRLIGSKVSQYDTIDMGTVATTALPSPPTVTFSAIPGVGTSYLVVNVTGAIGYVFSLKVIYGPGYFYTSGTITGTGTFSDTLELYTPDPNTPISYIAIGSYETGVPLTAGEVGRGSFTTPAIDTGYISSGINIVAYTDSIRASIAVHVGSLPGAIFATAYDSTGTMIQGHILSPVTMSGTYSYVFPTDPNQLVYITFEYSDPYRTTDTSIYARSLPFPTVAAANVSLSGSTLGNCGGVTIGTVTITGVVPGYPTLFKIARGTDGTTFPDTVDIIAGIRSDTVWYNYVVDADLANTKFYYRAIVFSVDGNWNVSNIRNAKTPTGGYPVIGLSVKDSVVPVINIVGDGFCDRTTVTITVTNSTGGVEFTTAIEVGAAVYNYWIQTATMASGTYTVTACARNLIGERCKTISFSHNIVTGISQYETEKVIDPSTELRVMIPLGQMFKESVKYGDIDEWLKFHPNGIYIFYSETLPLSFKRPNFHY